MHPIIAYQERLSIYLLGWLIFGVMLAAVLALPHDDFTWLEALAVAVPLMMVYGAICLSSWYVCRVYPLQKTPFTQVMIVQAMAAVLTILVWVTISAGWVMLLQNALAWKALRVHVLAKAPLFIGVGFILYSLTVAVHYLIVTFEASKESEQRELQSRIFAQEAELKALRAQINPHFLFNSLNSISALATQDPAAVRAMTLRLADFLRKSLRLGSNEFIRLEEEISMSLSFLEIEQIRYGARLQIVQKIEDVCKDCMVPPLILQPLIENAVHHGIAHMLDGGTISMEAEWRGSVLHLRIENPIDPDRPRKGKGGLGLDNVTKRLRAIYKDDAQLQTSESDGVFRSDLWLPAQTGIGIRRASPVNTPAVVTH
ncbi:MAG TPA: histidine kinase [Bacteroidota bacterium]|nr:histidine kinase [Bacteroidota bacterium]